MTTYFGAPYTSDDPRLAKPIEDQCEEGVGTENRCTARAVIECKSCGNPVCEEHALGNFCVDCAAERKAAPMDSAA